MEKNMQISLTGHHVEVTDSLHNYVDSKFKKLARHFDKVANIHVVLSVEKLRHKAEATLHIRDHDIHADSIQENMYAAIDSLTDKLDRQLIRQKEKNQNHRGNPAPEIIEESAQI